MKTHKHTPNVYHFGRDGHLDMLIFMIHVQLSQIILQRYENVTTGIIILFNDVMGKTYAINIMS